MTKRAKRDRSHRFVHAGKGRCRICGDVYETILHYKAMVRDLRHELWVIKGRLKHPWAAGGTKDRIDYLEEVNRVLEADRRSMVSRQKALWDLLVKMKEDQANSTNP